MEVLPGLHVFKIPLPGNPLKHVNCYLIEDNPPLLIDAGMNMEACYSAAKVIVERFGRPRVVATHLHADHLGLAGRIGREVLMGERDVECFEKFKRAEYWKDFVKFFISSGFPEDEAVKIFSQHPGIRYFHVPEDVKPLPDEIEAGEYSFKVIETPGHTPGHVCLYERSEGILISGDHVLFDITPNIGWWFDMDDPLASYIGSLKAIRDLRVKIVLPGHRNSSSELKGRVDEILEHHRRRLEEALEALDKEKTAWEVAQTISWDLEGEWDSFPLMQKWFAVSETIAHLEHLVRLGKVERVERDGRIYYR